MANEPLVFLTEVGREAGFEFRILNFRSQEVLGGQIVVEQQHLVLTSAIRLIDKHSLLLLVLLR